MLLRNDPRVQRALSQASHGFQTANVRVRENLYAFTQAYLAPCVSGLGVCLTDCTHTCFPSVDERRRLRRERERARAGRGGRRRAEFSFDFYDDWDQEESEALLRFDGQSLDVLQPDDWSDNQQQHRPAREPIMDYGTHDKSDTTVPSITNTTATAATTTTDTATIPTSNGKRPKTTLDSSPITSQLSGSSYFNFLSRFSFGAGPKQAKYTPSIANLQDCARSDWSRTAQQSELLGSPIPRHLQHTQSTSSTLASAKSTDSMSSRGDIFPSEDEMDDAVPIGDEFTLQLDRRATNSNKSSIISIADGTGSPDCTDAR